tara:strand:+ start:111 stop:1619 length:1509 start_codon:yes stop_codon:yes gene_type:complete
MTKARDLSKLLSTSNGKIAGSNLDVSFENITDTGTEGTKVASGTTAERGSTAGQVRFNTTLGITEYYTGTEFKAIDTPPTIISVDVTNIETSLGGNQTIVITGALFDTNATVKFKDNGGTEFTADTTTRNSSSQITVTKARSSFSDSNEPYDIIITNPSGLSATLENTINVDNSPTWSTASGNLANILDSATGTHATVLATDPDGDTVSYSLLSGSLGGLTIGSSNGVISGNPTDLSYGSTTINFTIRATANGKTADRAFNIVIAKQDGTSALGAVADGNALLALSMQAGNYWFKTGSAAAYQAYYFGEGWTPICAFSNKVSKYDLWFGNSYSSSLGSGSAATLADQIINSETSDGNALSLTQESYKIPAFWEMNINHLYFKVNFAGSTGYARYSPNANQTMKYMMINRTSTDARTSVSGTSEPFIGAIKWRQNLSDDGAYIQTTTGIVAEAVGGIMALVDGGVYNGEDTGWNGNITRTDSNRHYGNDGTTTTHTVWVYGKA